MLLPAILRLHTYHLLLDCVHQPLYFLLKHKPAWVVEIFITSSQCFLVPQGLVVANGFYVVHLLQKAGISPPCDHRFEPCNLKRATSDLEIFQKETVMMKVGHLRCVTQFLNYPSCFWGFFLNEKFDSNEWVNGKPFRFEEVWLIQFATSIWFFSKWM